MSAVRLVHNPEPVYKFREGKPVPSGVTAEGVIEEHNRIARLCGQATAQASAEEVLAHPETYPNLRAFGPRDAEEALRRAMEEGIRSAYRSVVEVVTQEPTQGQTRTVELRVFHAVPGEGGKELTYERIDAIWESVEKKAFLIRQLRKDARAFAQKLEIVLAEIEYWDR